MRFVYGNISAGRFSGCLHVVLSFIYDKNEADVFMFFAQNEQVNYVKEISGLKSLKILKFQTMKIG